MTGTFCSVNSDTIMIIMLAGVSLRIIIRWIPMADGVKFE